MQNVALGFLWLDGADTERARAWSQSLTRVYVIDAREAGELFSSFPEPRLHYAPYRQRVSPGVALNRALNLAFEENMAWLWLVDTATDLDEAEVLAWSQKASRSVGLYQSGLEGAPPKLWRKPPIGFLVSVDLARSLGGWDTDLPAQLVFADFRARLKAAGGRIENGPETRQSQQPSGFDVQGAAQSLWALLQKRLSKKSRC